MHIHLDAHYTKYTNGFSEHIVSGATIAECVKELCNRYPQLYVHFQDNDAAVCRKTVALLNAEYLVEEDSHSIVVTDDDVLELSTSVPTGDSRVLQMVLAVVMIIAAVVILVVTLGNGWAVSAFLVQFAIGLLVGGIMQLVMAAFFYPEAPNANIPDSIENSSTYTFDGIRNTTASGIAVPIIYGTHRVGGQVLNMYTEVSEASAEVQTISGVDVLSSQTHLYAQIGLCEGEIESMTDVQINKLPLDFYNEIESAPSERFVRVGAETQTPMADFTQVQNTVTISRKVLNLQGQTIQSIPVNYSSYLPVYGQPRWESPGYTLGNYALAVQYYEESGG